MGLKNVCSLRHRPLRNDPKPANSIVSAVATAWDLDISRKAAKVAEKADALQKQQITPRPPSSPRLQTN
jgi:hypothetical protein